jgi:hypothetical protein
MNPVVEPNGKDAGWFQDGGVEADLVEGNFVGGEGGDFATCNDVKSAGEAAGAEIEEMARFFKENAGTGVAVIG